jgi:hypothetical protein
VDQDRSHPPINIASQHFRVTFFRKKLKFKNPIPTRQTLAKTAISPPFPPSREARKPPLACISENILGPFLLNIIAVFAS